jgi:transcriptional regulator with XRE-family HTH domain
MLMIGQLVRQLREQRGLSQEELATRARVSNGYLSKLERDLCQPSAAVLQKISTALQAPLADLYRAAGLSHLLESPDPTRDPALELYLHQINHLPAHDRKIITEVLRRILAEEREYAADRDQEPSGADREPE